MERQRKYTSVIILLLLLGLVLVSNSCSSDSEQSPLAGKVTWLESTHQYGHTGIKIEADNLVIYLDPVDLVSIDDLPEADIILITHDHGDHYSPGTIAELSKSSTKVVSIAVVTDVLTDIDTHTLEPGGSITVDGIEIEGVKAYNASHPEDLGYLGFLFSVGGDRFYCSGDTSLNSEISALSNIDIAVMNVRNPYSLTGAEVVEFAEAVGPTYIVPIHWMPGDDTFNDSVEIEYIEENLPQSVSLEILELN